MPQPVAIRAIEKSGHHAPILANVCAYALKLQPSAPTSHPGRADPGPPVRCGAPLRGEAPKALWGETLC